MGLGLPLPHFVPTSGVRLEADGLSLAYATDTGPADTLRQLGQDVDLFVLDALDGAAVRHWVGGGWGVDVLVGRETRAHRDLDLAVDARDHDACLAALDHLGYAVETDCLPVRVEVVARGERWVDVHPVQFDDQGLGLQGDPEDIHFRYPPTAFTTGHLHGRRVPCLSAEQQEIFHSGYEPRPQDVHDLGLLAALRR